MKFYIFSRRLERMSAEISAYRDVHVESAKDSGYRYLAICIERHKLALKWIFRTLLIYTERILWHFFTTLSVVIWLSTGTLGIFASLVYTFTMRVVIYDILSMAIIPTLSTSILFCNLCYIRLWISPRSVVKIAIRI